MFGSMPQLDHELHGGDVFQIQRQRIAEADEANESDNKATTGGFRATSPNEVRNL